MARINDAFSTGTVFTSVVVDLSTTDFTFTSPDNDIRGVYVSVTGTIVGRLRGDSIDTTWNNVPVGDFLRAFSVIRKTGTTATVTHGLI